MQSVEIPGQGVAEFPDEMSPDDIKGVIKQKFFSQPQQGSNEVIPAQVQPAKRGLLTEIFGGYTPTAIAGVDVSPPPSPEAMAAPFIEIPKIGQQEGAAAQVGAGIVNTLAHATEGLETGTNVALLPTLMVPGLNRVVAGGFGLQALSDLPAATEAFMDADTLQGKTEAAGRGLTDILFGAAGFKFAVKGHGAAKPRVETIEPATSIRPAPETQPRGTTEAGNGVPADPLQPLIAERNRLLIQELPKHPKGSNGEARIEEQIAALDKQIREGIVQRPLILSPEQSAEPASQFSVPSETLPEALPVSSGTQGATGAVSTAKAVTPNDFTPALRTKEGEVIVGEQGHEHAAIYKTNPEAGASEPEHGFVDKHGKFHTREEVSMALGETEPMQSARLIELQNAEKAKPVSAGEPTSAGSVSPPKAKTNEETSSTPPNKSSRSKTVGKSDGETGKIPNPSAVEGRSGAGATEPASTTGISQAAHEGRVGEAVQPGEGVSPEELVKRGRELKAAGADPEVIAAKVDNGQPISADDTAVLRAHIEDLAKESNRTQDLADANPKDATAKQAAEAAFKAETDFRQRIKPAATEASNVFKAYQGQTEIDSGTFTGLRRAFQERTGRDVKPTEAPKLKKAADQVQKTNVEVEASKTKFSEVVEKETRGRKPKSVDELRNRFAERIRSLTPCD